MRLAGVAWGVWAAGDPARVGERVYLCTGLGLVVIILFVLRTIILISNYTVLYPTLQAGKGYNLRIAWSEARVVTMREHWRTP